MYKVKMTFTSVDFLRKRLEADFREALPRCSVDAEVICPGLNYETAMIYIHISAKLPEGDERSYVAVRQEITSDDIDSLLQGGKDNDERIRNFVDVLSRRTAMGFGTFAYMK